MTPHEEPSAAPFSLPPALSRLPVPGATLADGHLEPGRIIGDVIVDGLVGRGGMSEVYRVRHRIHQRVLALKILDPRVYRSAGHRYQHMLFARLRREGRLQLAIRHPNIVRVEAIVETDDGPALIMELVEGPSLDTLLKRREVLDWDDVDDIAQGLMSALARAQRAGVVHRDIKPGNVLLTRRDGRWVPKLIDFGLAKHPGDGDELTVTGQVMGTPGYMPLSQMTDAKHVDGTVDTYALGAVLYELTTGRRLVPSSKRVSPDVVGRALHDLSQTDVPGRMQQAITAAVHATRASRSAGDVLAFWKGTAPGSSEPAWRSWGLLFVLSTFAASWLALGILALG